MAQVNLFSGWDGLASISLHVERVATESALQDELERLSITTKGFGVPPSSPFRLEFRGLGCDYLPDAVKAAVDAYLWGESYLAPVTAAIHVHGQGKRFQAMMNRQGKR